MFSLDQNYLERLVESSADTIVAVDTRGAVIYYNDGARKLLHYNADEIIGQNVVRLYPTVEEAKRVMRAMRESTDGGRISGLETVFRSKESEDIPVVISGSVIYDDSGNIVGSIGFARDIREMRRREQLATAGEIAVSLAHEINNPLECMTNTLDLLEQARDDRAGQAADVVEAERLEIIRDCLNRVQEIVRRLDEMARKGVYQTRDYLQGKRMADLGPREASGKEAREDGAIRQWPLTGMSVLVLDDDTAVVTSLADLLRAERCIVYTAVRPSNALALLRNVKIDTVISDVVMPEMDGYEFYMRVKEEWPQLPVILMTAYYYDKDHIIKRSRLKGLESALFKKPVNPAKLRQVLLQSRGKPAPPKVQAAV
ncbi:MAG TPA: response regulator [Candidatus Binataceae bacterium]|nr:response regulator [Candidatus Binataceae bacterium]